jgi:hypothetical protein
MFGALEKLAKRQAEMDALQAAARKEAELAAAAKAKFADPAVAPPGPLTLYHGSPFKFEEFDFENNLKKGEGALAFGPGGYMTGHEPLARQYAKTLYDKHNGGAASLQTMRKAIAEDPKAMAEYLRMVNVGRAVSKGQANPRAAIHTNARSLPDWLTQQLDSPRMVSKKVFDSSVPAYVERDVPEWTVTRRRVPSGIEQYADLVSQRFGANTLDILGQSGRVGRGGMRPDDAKAMGNELRKVIESRAPGLRPRLRETVSRPSLEDLATLKRYDWNPRLVDNTIRGALNSTWRVLNDKPGNTGIKISMDPASRGPYSGGTVDLRNPMAQQDSDQFARRLYSAPLDASWADMLPYDYPIETVTPKLMGALTQLAAQHGDLDLLRPRMTGQEFINTLRGKPIDKMRALKEAGVPATFFLRGGQRGKLPDVLSPEDFNFVIHDQTRLGKPEYDEFAKGGAV